MYCFIIAKTEFQNASFCAYQKMPFRTELMAVSVPIWVATGKQRKKPEGIE